MESTPKVLNRNLKFGKLRPRRTPPLKVAVISAGAKIPLIKELKVPCWRQLKARHFGEEGWSKTMFGIEGSETGIIAEPD